MARQGAIDSPPKTPFIMGSECAGDIEQVGEGVENFKVSKRARSQPLKYSMHPEITSLHILFTLNTVVLVNFLKLLWEFSKLL